MSCRIENGRAILPNGKDSKLLKDLRDAVGSNAEAEAMYESIYGEEFKKFYGFDFEKQDISQIERFANNLDENNEPRLFAGIGIYEFLNSKMKSFPVSMVDKQQSRVLDLNRTEVENAEIQSELINTLIGFTNTLKIKAGVDNADIIFNTLKDKTLLAAFNNTIDIEKAKELFKILNMGENGYNNFIKKIEEENISLAPMFDVFISAYDQWESKQDALGNTQTIGVRDILKDSFSRYNMRLRNGESILEELDDEFVRVYNNSRLQDNPQNKLSAKAKAILSNISVGENSLGFPETLPTDRVYAIVAEAAVGQPDFEEMISRLDYLSVYKPEVKAIVTKLLSLKPGEKAAIFSAFKNTYKKFLLFKKEKTNKYGVRNLIINSNQSNVAIRAKRNFRDNSTEYGINNPRAVYISGQDKLSVKPEKVKRIRKAWDIVKQAEGKEEWTEQQLDALGTYLWELGMNYGPTLESTQNNIKSYYTNGNESRITKGDLLSSFVFEPNKNFEKLIKLLETTPSQNFHDKEGSIVTKIAGLSILFDSQPFGTFISGTNKQYYPVNLPTAVDELTELFNDPKQIYELRQFVQSLKEDPFFNPGVNKYKSVLLRALTSPKGNAKENFIAYVLDSYKDGTKDAVDYSSQNDKTSLKERLIGYVNRNSAYSLSALHIQADRRQMGFIQVPKISRLSSFGITLSRTEIIEGLIIQDLARIDQANKLLKTKDESKIIEGYHYKKGSDKYAKDGSVYTMTQIYGLVNTKIHALQDMSDLLDNFLAGNQNTDSALFKKLLAEKVQEVEDMLTGFEQDLETKLTSFDVQLVRDVDSNLNNNEKKSAFIKDFIFDEFVNRIEITKLLRSGYSFAKDEADFYKRMGLVNTPGTKLAIQGFDENDTQYGMMPKYNALVIKDFDFQDRERAIEVVETLKRNGLSEEIANKYLPKSELNEDGVNKSDAQSFISVDMYRGIMQGMGQWTQEDENAYKVYLQGGGYNRPVAPLKPYHEQTNVKDGLSTMHMDKNSYTVVTPELAKDFEYLRPMLEAFRTNKVHVVHTESATKGARINVQDYQATQELDLSTPMVMDSSKLRFPQMIPVDKKDRLTFNRQLRKNIITNVEKEGQYTIDGKQMSGADVQRIFEEAVADNINEDTQKVERELGLTKLNRIKDKESVEHKEAKLAHLKAVRSKIEQEVVERDLPQNYLNGLDIVPNGPFDYKFRIPLGFPTLAAKFETIIAGVFNKEIYKQTLKGQEAVQIAELGGHDLSGELRMYNGENGGAEVRIKASTLGFTKKELEGFTDEEGNPREATPADFEGDPRLEFIGFRIPQQGKSSAMVFRTVDFLPESYEKAIMVPGALTVQMGSDFDIDKLNLIFKEVGKLNERQKRNNTIYEVLKGILLDPKHLEEVMTPVANEELKALAKVVGNVDTSINYNNPLIELDMENRQKMGIAGRGLHSNIIKGRNTAEKLGSLTVRTEYAPIIDGKRMPYIQTKDVKGNFTDANISQYLSAAVDAAKAPIQIDINDNVYTIPVTGLLLSVGVPIETVVYFLAQPSIKALIKDAELNDVSPNKLVSKIKIGQKAPVQPMTLSQLKEESLDQEYILRNFAYFYRAGKQMQRVYKIITPGDIDNVNELSSINAWIDEESYFLYSQNSIIEGAEDYITHQLGSSKPLSPMGSAYRGVLDTIIKNTSQLGFIQNTTAFNTKKQHIKEALGIQLLTAGQHKFISRALYGALMTQPHSPLMQKIGDKAGLLSDVVIRGLYTPESKNNIVIKLRDIGLKHPKLNNNAFYRLLREDPSNKETGLARIQLDTGINLSVADKNDLSNALLSIIKDPNQEISAFGKYLVANQFITSGFFPTYGSYIDLIPSEALTTDILNPGKGSPVEFFEQEITQLTVPEYLGFVNFTHEFVRNFGTRRPGGVELLRTVKLPLGVVRGEVTFPDLDSRVYDEQTGYIKYFKSKNGVMYVYRGGSSYKQLAPLGIENKILEVGTTDVEQKSVFKQNQGQTTTTDKPVDGYISMTPDTNEDTDIDDPIKVCRKK